MSKAEIEPEPIAKRKEIINELPDWILNSRTINGRTIGGEYTLRINKNGVYYITPDEEKRNQDNIKYLDIPGLKEIIQSDLDVDSVRVVDGEPRIVLDE